MAQPFSSVSTPAPANDYEHQWTTLQLRRQKELKERAEGSAATAPAPSSQQPNTVKVTRDRRASELAKANLHRDPGFNPQSAVLNYIGHIYSPEHPLVPIAAADFASSGTTPATSTATPALHAPSAAPAMSGPSQDLAFPATPAHNHVQYPPVPTTSATSYPAAGPSMENAAHRSYYGNMQAAPFDPHYAIPSTPALAGNNGQASAYAPGPVVDPRGGWHLNAPFQFGSLSVDGSGGMEPQNEYGRPANMPPATTLPPHDASWTGFGSEPNYGHNSQPFGDAGQPGSSGQQSTFDFSHPPGSHPVPVHPRSTGVRGCSQGNNFNFNFNYNPTSLAPPSRMGQYPVGFNGDFSSSSAFVEGSSSGRQSLKRSYDATDVYDHDSKRARLAGTYVLGHVEEVWFRE
ncbi:unnamed protein product [Peniophora sp. CBMAI 1063]|nr:unnamed protein product [Peniophora sp. CBMAI 1063]